ncbi:MAG: F0F1 ATP synthase subunit epsilon, partial [Oscillospiraceae bacterium]
MADTFELKIVSPEKLEYQGQVTMVSVPAVTGLMTVLPNHAPIIALLETKTMSYVEKSQKNELVLSNGFMEFSDNKMIILTD